MKALMMGTVMGSNPCDAASGRRKYLISVLFRRIGYAFRYLSTIALIRARFARHIHARCKESSTHACSL